MLENKAYLFKGVQINWKCDESLIKADNDFPNSKKICYLNVILDFMKYKTSSNALFPLLFFMETLKLETKQLNGLLVG